MSGPRWFDVHFPAVNYGSRWRREAWLRFGSRRVFVPLGRWHGCEVCRRMGRNCTLHVGLSRDGER
jgi:hypothetical protein